ncbi:MAG: CapA family protein [Clostridiaceae bacterium]
MVMNNKLPLITILIGCITLAGCQFLPSDSAPLATPSEITEKAQIQVKAESQIEPEKKVIIAAVGDIMVHQPQFVAQETGVGEYDFTNNFKYVKPIITNADLSIANLETTILKSKSISTFPTFNSPPEILDALKNTGFDLISTINNHSLDTGKKGVLSTLEELHSRGFLTIGTYKDENEEKYTIKIINEMKIGFTAFTSGYVTDRDITLNTIPSKGIKDQLNVMDITNVNDAFKKIKVQIEQMKVEKCDFIVVILHWGTEYQESPNRFQKELAQKLIDEGVGLILGSHPHLVQSMEFMKSSDKSREGLVVYSMGNFLSNQRNEILNIEGTENGLISITTLARNEKGSVYIEKAEYIPTWVNLFEKNSKFIYEIVPISEDTSETSVLFNASEDKLKRSLSQAKTAIKDEQVKIYAISH